MKIKSTFELSAEAKRKLGDLKQTLRYDWDLPTSEAAIVEALIMSTDEKKVVKALEALED